MNRLAEYNLQVAELYRDMTLRCRSVGMNEECYPGKCAEYAQHALDRRAGRSRLVYSTQELGKS